MVCEANMNIWTKFYSNSCKAFWKISAKNYNLLVTLDKLSGYIHCHRATSCLQNVNICPKLWLTCWNSQARSCTWPKLMWHFWLYCMLQLYVPSSQCQTDSPSQELHLQSDAEEDEARMVAGIISLRLPRIALPEMSSEALWNKKAIKVTWVPENALSFRKACREKHANMNRRRGNGQRTLWSNRYASALTRSYYILPKKVHTWVTCKSSVVRDTIDQQTTRLCSATAVTQTRRLFHSDSLQMPPGQEAKINTICSGTGMQ